MEKRALGAREEKNKLPIMLAKKTLAAVSFLLFLIAFSCTGDNRSQNTFLGKSEQDKFKLDSVLFPERFIKDSVLLCLFHKGKYEEMLRFQDSLISKKGRTLLTLALIEEDFDEVKRNLEKYLPEVQGLNVIKGKETSEYVYQDNKSLERLPLYKRYAIYKFLLQEHGLPVSLISYFKTWFNFDNEYINDPIIKNEFLYISAKLSEIEGYDPYTADYLNYTDSLINTYPENFHLKALLADIYVDLGDEEKALIIYKSNYRKSGKPELLLSIIDYYKHYNHNKDSLIKYQKMLKN